ncbi:hypothetical protein GQR58_029933 [Nymphon striatum]|nr:hypothetical protein GQR58_029933 [Nymphon striatum]
MTEAKIDDRDAVADTLLGDQLAHPHQQCRTGGQREYHETNTRCGEGWKQVKTIALLTRGASAEATPLSVEQEGETSRLHNRNGDRQVTGPLGDLSLTNSALVLPLLNTRNDDAKDLHDDRRRDVREDTKGEDRHLRQGTTGEERKEVEHAAALELSTSSNGCDSVEVDPGRRMNCADAVDDDHRQGDALRKIDVELALGALDGDGGAINGDPSRSSMPANATLSFELGMMASSCIAVLALRMRVNMSATGSVIIATSPTRELLVTPGTSPATKDAGPAGFTVVIDDHGCVLIELDVAAVGTAAFFLGAYNHALHYFALFDTSRRDGIFDGGDNDVAYAGVADL